MKHPALRQTAMAVALLALAAAGSPAQAANSWNVTGEEVARFDAALQGWQVVGAPTIIGPKGPQSDWIERRPEQEGRSITFVNVEGIASSADEDRWSRAKIIFTLKAPGEVGDLPLVGAYFYGTEKASPHGFKLNTVGWKMPRGTLRGGSGRVRFSDEHTVTVNAPAAAE